MKGLSRILLLVVLAVLPCWGSSLDDDIRQRQADLAAIKTLVEPKILPLLVHSDLRLWVSQRVLESIPNLYNAQAQKTFKYQATDHSGDFLTGKLDWPGCDTDHETVSHNDFWASLDIPSVAVHYIEGIVKVSARYHLVAGGTIHLKITCLLVPIGEDIEFKTFLDGNFAADLVLSSSEADALVYSLTIVEPARIETTANLTSEDLPLPRSFAIPFSYSFNIPRGAIAKGSVPNLFRGGGEIGWAGPAEFHRRYAFVIREISSRGQADGYAMTANANISWE